MPGILNQESLCPILCSSSSHPHSPNSESGSRLSMFLQIMRSRPSKSGPTWCPTEPSLTPTSKPMFETTSSGRTEGPPSSTTTRSINAVACLCLLLCHILDSGHKSSPCINEICEPCTGRAERVGYTEFHGLRAIDSGDFSLNPQASPPTHHLQTLSPGP